MKTSVILTPFQVAIVRSLIGQYRDGIEQKSEHIISEFQGMMDAEYLNDFVVECDDLLSQLPSKDLDETPTFS